MINLAYWLEKNNQEEVISRRPMPERATFGFAAGLLLWLIDKLVPHLTPLFSEPAAWGAVSFILLFLGLIVCCFLLGTGPRRLRFDLRRQQYSLKQGILFLTWTKQGQTTGGEIYLIQSKSGYYQIRFRAAHWRFGLPLESFKTKEEAHSQAEQIAGKLGLNVKCRD